MVLLKSLTDIKARSKVSPCDSTHSSISQTAVTAHALCAPRPTVISRVNAIFLGTDDDSLCLLLTGGNNWRLLTQAPCAACHTTLSFTTSSSGVLLCSFFGFYFGCSTPFSRGRTLEQWWQRPPQFLPACFWVQGTVSNILPRKKQLLTQAEEHYSHLLIFSMNTGWHFSNAFLTF